jgi:hypothetical protein
MPAGGLAPPGADRGHDAVWVVVHREVAAAAVTAACERM